MAADSETRLDVVIFGASGFTGRYAVEEVLKLSKEKGNLSWGISGRNQTKLEEALAHVSKKTGEDLSKIPILVADVGDEESLKTMAARARVVVNCAGPYRFYGEPVVKACIASGTHHVDISGEPQYMERMQLEYHKEAEEKGVYVVSACGFDSIPADLGTVFLMNKFEGEVNSVESYLETWTEGGLKSGIHYGTWESAVYGLAHAHELRPLRQKLFPNKLPEFTPKQSRRSMVHKSDQVQGWCVPFPGSDRSVVMRSQRHFFDHDKLRPIQMQAYVAIRSLLSVIAIAIFGTIFALLTKSKFGRKLLLKYPGFFTGGLVSHEGPSEESMKNTRFSWTLCAEGWKEKLSEPTDQHTTPLNKKMTVKVSGTDPGYVSTCTALVLSAVTILKESDKMPGKGGVYPPGAAFAKTSLIGELEKHDIKFEIISTEEK